LNVTVFGTNRKHNSTYVLVINSNLHPISHSVIADYWSDFALLTGGTPLQRILSLKSLNIAIDWQSIVTL